MKKLITLILVMGILLAGGYFLYLFVHNGKVVSSSGEVLVLNKSTNNWEAMPSGYVVKNGDSLKTGEGASANIVLGKTGGAILRVAANTETQINSKEPIDIDIIDGEVFAAVTRPSKIGGFKVKTPNSVCAARGTGWSVGYHKESGTEIEVFEGRVKAGENDFMYENNPYIIRNTDILKIEGSDLKKLSYEKIDEDKYGIWNNWISKATNALSKNGIYNNLVQEKPNEYPVWQNGMTYACWQTEGYMTPESEVSFPKMEKDTNCSWVNFIATWYQQDVYSTNIYPHIDKTPGDESIEYIILKAREKGQHVMLSPQLDLEATADGSWRAEIGFSSDAEWNKWFESYEAMLLHYAKLAEKNDVEILNIGTELTLTTLQRPDKWKKMIEDVRKVYSGKLVYTANWFEEYLDITFWKELDYAGISAYFPLSEKVRPTYSEIRNGWEEWKKEIKAWQLTHGKPVLFPEIGYRSIEGTAQEPWQYSKGGQIDLKQQYNCYKAAMETFYDEEWFYGMYWWAWRIQPAIQGKFHRGYTPNDKPASELVNLWYSKPDPRKYKNIFTRIKENFKERMK